MTDPSSKRVVVDTRFSRLRKSPRGDTSAPSVDVRYEALSALSEAMEILSHTLDAHLHGKRTDHARQKRLTERVDVLVELLRGLPSDAGNEAEASGPSDVAAADDTKSGSEPEATAKSNVERSQTP